MAGKLNIKLRRGSTYRRKFRWEVEPFVYKAITGVAQTAPLRLTVPGHGLLPNQTFVIQAVLGMTELNDTGKESDWHPATVIDSNTIELNRVNASGFKAYVSGGNIKYRTVVDPTGYTVAMQIRTKVDGEALLSLTSAEGGFVIDGPDKSIEIIIPSDAVSTWKKGVYDIELTNIATSEVVDFLAGDVTVSFDLTQN